MHKFKTKAKSYGHLEGAIGPMMDKMPKPVLRVEARVDHYPSDNKWRKEDLKRQRSELKVLEGEMKNWDDARMAAQAKTSLKKEIARARARVMETEAFMDDEGDDAA